MASGALASIGAAKMDRYYFPLIFANASRVNRMKKSVYPLFAYEIEKTG